MPILQISEQERIRETNGCYEIERRYERDGGCEWHAYEYHGTLSEALSAAAYREIHSLPNADLNQWKDASDKVLAKYEQILARAVESRLEV